MVSIALVDARKTSLTGVENSKKKSARRYAAADIKIAPKKKKSARRYAARTSPLRGSWTMLRIVVWVNPPPPPLGKKLDPPLNIYHQTIRIQQHFAHSHLQQVGGTHHPQLMRHTSVARGGGGGGGGGATAPPPPIMLFRSFVGTSGNLSVHVSRQAYHLYRQNIILYRQNIERKSTFSM